MNFDNLIHARLTLYNDSMKNPSFLFISLRNKNDEIIFDTLKDSDDFKWEYKEKYISQKNNDGCFFGVKDNKLVLTSDKIFEWEIIDNKILFNKNNGFYLSCNLDYQIEFTYNKKHAIPIYFSEYGIHYIKPKFRLDFDNNNLKYNLEPKNIIPSQISFGTKNIGILLIGGFGTRFDNNIEKQLYKIDSTPLFIYSLKILINTLDSVVIVTNSKCLSEVKEIIKMDYILNNKEIFIVTNDIGDRLESIDVGLNFITKYFSKNVLNFIIHDGSRPFIKEKHISNLLSIVKDDIFYSQYYLNLTNGLLKCNNENYEEVDRDDFIEICTPICGNFGLFSFLFSNYIKKERRICWEVIPLLDLLKIKYELIKGSSKSLQKITTKDDLEDVV